MPTGTQRTQRAQRATYSSVILLHLLRLLRLLRPLRLCLCGVALLEGCKKEPEKVVYQAVPVARRSIVVSAQAAGAIQPDTTVEVKSKASGEILKLSVETGQVVKRGAPLVLVDPRNARNALEQAQADLDVGRAQLENATSAKRRADTLFATQSITQQEHEQSLLDYANAKAAVVRAKVSVDNARIQLEDTDVRAPIEGTIIEKDVERGTVIASATANVSGGTTLLKMADLNLVQVNTLVDETDIGKVQAGQLATVTVDAYPNRTFDGTVLKIEPQATTQQNVTVFPVLIRIDNRSGLLRPGMNTEVEIHVGERDSVLAVPNAALRTQRDVGSAARVLGLSPEQVQKQLAASAPSRGAASGSFGATDGEPRDSLSRRVGAGAPGASDSGVRRPASDSRFRDRADSGMRARRGRGGAAGGFMRQARSTDAGGGRYIVFAKRGGTATPVWIRTGLTDLDYSEVLQGLKEGDSVYVLPSASLVQSQQDMKQRMNQITGGGAVPGMRQQTSGPTPGGGGGPPGR
jgi:HlyD family secretion protein